MVSQELLHQALHLPVGTLVMRIIERPEIFAGSYELIVENPDLPEVLEGQEIPQVMPVITRHDYLCSDVDPLMGWTEYTWDWGLEESE